MGKALSKYEKETIIYFNDAEDEAIIYTCNNSLKNKLDKFCEKSSEIIVIKEDEFSKEYKIPKKWIKVKMPRQLSEKQRTELIKRAKENFGHEG